MLINIRLSYYDLCRIFISINHSSLPYIGLQVVDKVHKGQTISTIAKNYNILPKRLIFDNGINNPNNLVIGQTIVILFPLITYIIQEGDTLGAIAQIYQVTVMQLIRNNPYLSERVYLIPGKTIVISYETIIR